MARPIVVLCMLFAPFANAQEIITRVAGGPFVFPLSVNGSPAIAAPFREVNGVAVDPAGNVYASDAADNIVVRISPGGTLTIVAGNGQPGFSGDAGPASSATLSGPTGLALDRAGNLYIADTYNECVRRVGTDGMITTVAGAKGSGYSAGGGDDGPATQAYLSAPMGLAADASGNLYIASPGLSEVRRVDSSGIIHAFAGGWGLGFSGDGDLAIRAQLSGPQGLAVDPNTGNVFIADTQNLRIRMVTPAGIISTVAGTGQVGCSGDGGPATAAQIAYPSGVAIDPAGRIYIAVTGVVGPSNRMRSFTVGGSISSLANGLDGSAVAADRSGNLFFAQGFFVRELTAEAAIVTVGGSGTAQYYGDGGPATSAQLYFPEGIVVDGAGGIYVADYTNHVRRIAPNAIISTVAGTGQAGFAGDGGPGTSALLANPQGLALDTAGNLYIADGGNNRVRKLTPGGSISTVAGTGQAGFSGDGGLAINAQLNFPVGIAVDAAGTMYIADARNYRIRAVSPTETIRTFAGTGVMGFAGDGGPATAAQLSAPSGIAVDSTGSLFIVDSSILANVGDSNQRVRKVDAKGVISTIAGTGLPGYSGDGGPATSAQVCFPEAIAVDSAGNVFFLDAGNEALRKITPGGVISTLALGSLGTNDYLKAGGGVALDGTGDILFSEYLGNVVTKVTPSFVPYLGTPSAYNAASFLPAGSAGLAPGSLISLFGFNLASRATSAASEALPTTLLDTAVTIAGIAAPLLYVSPTQVNLQIPFEVAIGQANVELSRPSAGTAISSLAIASVSPGIFRVGANPLANLGAILTQTGEVAVTPGDLPGAAARPAHPGEYVSIYCTGLGDVTNRPATGSPAPGGPSYSDTLVKPKVTIGGLAAMVSYSGLAPGYTGLYQVNVQVPANATPGILIPVTLTIGNAADTVNMSIQ